MSPENLTVFIPSLKKTVAFQDDLVKKLDGSTLVQRAIDKARELPVANRDIHLLTDSEEIRLIAKRNRIGSYWYPNLRWDIKNLQKGLLQYLIRNTQDHPYILLLSPYAPLIPSQLIKESVQALNKSGLDILKPVRKERIILSSRNGQNILDTILGSEKEIGQVESRAFVLLKSRVISKGRKQQPKIFLWHIHHDLLEIRSPQDWWICEKLLQRKRIVFRIIGNKKAGMGHIYRALSLAHEISDHEVIFVCDAHNSLAINYLAGYDYWLEIYEPKDIVQRIINLQPNLVVNDILSTTEGDVWPLQEEGIKVVNFEDIGKGALLANLTINELYDEPQLHGDNILWGHKYFFVRDEFYSARPHRFKKRVDTIMLSFGGTDQHDLTRKVFHAIKILCRERNIHINILTGPGYVRYTQLLRETDGNSGVSLTKSTGVISSIMEKSQLAIVSNGRTVYELAHMNIPSIVISQHSREEMHNFACEENGFVSLGLFVPGKTERDVLYTLKRLLDDEFVRRKLFNGTTRFQFIENKQRVLEKILDLLDTIRI